MSSRMWILIGGGVIAVSALIAIGIVTVLGGASLSDDPESFEAPPVTGILPAIEPSEAADLLQNKSFEEMTDDELELVRDEAIRVFEDAEFRATSAAIIGIDVIRRDGTTRATRQWSVGMAPNKEQTLLETRSFFCDAPADGFLDAYRTSVGPLGTTKGGERILATSQAFDRTLSAADWLRPRDLGFDEIEGRRVHGVELPYAPLGGGEIPWQIWLDVENARLLKRAEVDEAGTEAAYILDWRTPPKIETTSELGVPPCYDDIYPDEAATP